MTAWIALTLCLLCTVGAQLCFKAYHLRHHRMLLWMALALFAAAVPSTMFAVRDLGIARVWDDGHSARPYADGAGQTFWEVEVNGAGIDLAYVYINTSAGWENLALELGLDASDVPRTLPPERLPR